MPDILLFKLQNKRHQKAINPETGHLLGYARWNLPPQYTTNAEGLPVWPEAVFPAVFPEEEARFLQIANDTIWDPRGEDLEEELRQVKKEILARRDYMCMKHMSIHSLVLTACRSGLSSCSSRE
jgi:hypothetical protein